MAKARTAPGCGRSGSGRLRWAALCWFTGSLALGASVPVQAAPTVTQMLTFQPKQQGVVCTTPSADKQANCKVELVKGQRGSGWVLKDEEGNTLRRFFDSNGDNRIDVWSYYKDGAEVYTEMDTTYEGKANQYRWLNAGGSRWGIDEDRDGKIDAWKVISPEEVGQEVLLAVINRDFTRLKTLLITEADIKALEIPTEQANAIREQLKAAPDKFQDTVAKATKVSAKSTFIHLETMAPQCLPAEQTGSHYDIVKHARGTILYDTGAGNSDWLQTGEMIQVGTAWKLVSAPVPGANSPEPTAGSKGISNLDENPELQKLIEKLTELDKQAPQSNGGPSAAVAQHHMQRADVLEQIVAKVKPAERDPWIRQVADSLSTAAQASTTNENVAMTRLTSLEQQLGSALPAGHALTAYVTYREMQADYSRKLAASTANGGKNPDFNQVQQGWLDRLGKFVQAFPQGEDTPDALLQAGMVSEFLNKEVEAKNWYGQLVRNFADKPQAKKAEGSVRRLELEGKPLQLAAPTLGDPNTAYDIEQGRGKVVVVYYWASWNSQCTGDFAKMKQLLDANSGKVELVCVNLDNTAEEGRSYVSRQSVPGTHLFQPGGLESKLATAYGIQVLPTVFLVGKDGKVVNRSAQVANLEDELKKLLK
jgi:thiol-disulfide isomerase/thioredoxin